MMRLSRGTVAMSAALAAGAVLTGCGGAQIPNEDQADTIACRGYELSVSSTDVSVGKELMNNAQGGVDEEGTKSLLAPVRAAAAGAGGTAGLSDASYERFRTVVITSDAILTKLITLDDGTTMLAGDAITSYQKAVAAVHKHCS